MVHYGIDGVLWDRCHWFIQLKVQYMDTKENPELYFEYTKELSFAIKKHIHNQSIKPQLSTDRSNLTSFNEIYMHSAVGVHITFHQHRSITQDDL